MLLRMVIMIMIIIMMMIYYYVCIYIQYNIVSKHTINEPTLRCDYNNDNKIR